MSSAAQAIANRANAQYSTGPKTEEGKAKSARNNTSHGLAGRAFFLPEASKEEFYQFEANLKTDMNPRTELENQAFVILRDAVWRIHTIRRLMVELQRRHAGADPLTHPETEAEVKQLTRYRASAEMMLYRAIHLYRELKARTVVRENYLTAAEEAVFPPLAENVVVKYWGRRFAEIRNLCPTSLELPPVCIRPPDLLS